MNRTLSSTRSLSWPKPTPVTHAKGGHCPSICMDYGPISPAHIHPVFAQTCSPTCFQMVMSVELNLRFCFFNLFYLAFSFSTALARFPCCCMRHWAKIHQYITRVTTGSTAVKILEHSHVVPRDPHCQHRRKCPTFPKWLKQLRLPQCEFCPGHTFSSRLHGQVVLPV